MRGRVRQMSTLTLQTERTRRMQHCYEKKLSLEQWLDMGTSGPGDLCSGLVFLLYMPG